MEKSTKILDTLLSDERMCLLQKLNLPWLRLVKVTSMMRQLLAMCGTDNTDCDLYGDGDQSAVGELGLL
eukprot:896393-Ditylum_brightwellii.AAC.1